MCRLRDIKEWTPGEMESLRFRLRQISLKVATPATQTPGIGSTLAPRGCDSYPAPLTADLGGVVDHVEDVPGDADEGTDRDRGLRATSPVSDATIRSDRGRFRNRGRSDQIKSNENNIG